MRSFVFLALGLLIAYQNLPAQVAIDHWETVVTAEDTWRYRIGNTEPPANWLLPSFVDSNWPVGKGGIGYGDGDDNTIISPTISLYLRKKFEVVDEAALEMAILHADYDDGFVAYLNGVEVARSNVRTAR